MNKLANTKSQLAKLMATENLTVQHQNVPTASFDVKNRVLTIPNLKDGLNVNLYDLMTSHEVGHALWTPEAGWHDAVATNGPAFKGFVNVVEDARIEKKIKSKYPGLAKAYREGYSELLQRDFFGIAGKDITEMAFIDRINLHFKLGTLVNLQFEGEEAEWVRKIENAETFEEVMQISQELYGQQIEQAEQEMEETLEDLLAGAGEQSDDENEGTETDGSAQNDDQAGDEDDDQAGDQSENGDQADDDMDSSGYDDYEDDDIDELEETPSSPEELIESQTDAAFRSNEGTLVKKTGQQTEYLTLGTLKSDDFVVPFSKINALYKAMLSGNSVRAEVDAKWSEWRQNNQKVVNYMVKEFELKKKADEFKRASTAKSGELDMAKIYSYKFNDDLFKRVTTVTGGKNHGFSILLDWSGSMAGNMAATIDQMLNLVMFCKKVKIPFEVFAFSDHYSEYRDTATEMAQMELRHKRDMKSSYMLSQPVGTLVPDTSSRSVSLMTLFSSEMKLSEFNDACLGMIAMRECLSNGRYYRFNIPSSLQLGGTPLDDALLLMPDVIKKFRERTRVQVANLVVLTDGDSQTTNAIVQYEGQDSVSSAGVYAGYSKTTVIQDSVTKQPYTVQNRSITNTLIEMIADRCGVNTIGFFIMDNKTREIRHAASRYGIYDQNITKTIRAKKFLEVKNAGYQSFFLIPGGDDMLTSDSGLVVDDGASKAKLKTAFMKNSKSKTANRVLLSRLMEIAA
jgi:hypothetical protein